MRIVSLNERKAVSVNKMRIGIIALKDLLSNYSRENNGRFLLYGSVSRNQYRFNSDIDIVVDFPVDQINLAWKFAEQACIDCGLSPDIRPLS
jgi:hypothetical protein